MWVIKNRVTGEYDRKGMYKKRDKINRSAWTKLSHAKCHVTLTGFSEWYMNADFIEMTDEGIGKVIPVSEYLREYYRNDKWAPKSILIRLGLHREDEPSD